MTTVKSIMINLDDTYDELVIAKKTYNGSSFKSLDRNYTHQMDVNDMFHKTNDDVVPYHKDIRQTRSVENMNVINGKIDNETPYAITFTLPTDYMIDINCSPKVSCRDYRLLISQLRHVQVKFMELRIGEWLKRFKRLMRMTNDRFDIHSYEIYHEFTAKGQIHSHGLLLCNNNYTTATSNAMADLWVKVNPGRKGLFSAVKKCSMGYGRNKAFDKCNNILSWRKYITKESIKWANKPCYYREDINALINYIE